MAKGLKVERVLFTMSREPGLGFVVGDQQGSNVKPVVKGNTAVHIVLRQTLPEDIEQAAKMLGLSPEMRARIPMLPTGTAIARDEEHPKAFVVRLHDPFPNLPYPADEETVAACRDQLSELEAFVVPRSRGTAPASNRSLEQQAPHIKEGVQPAWTACDPMAAWKGMLRFILENPELGIADLYRALEMGRNKGDRLKSDLLAMGLVEQYKGDPNGRGKPKMHLQLTKRGLEYLGAGEVPAAEPLKGKGSTEHRLLQKAIATALQAKGMLAVIEADIQGRKKVDVLAHDIPAGRTFGVEVHLNRKWALLEEQLLKGAEAGLKEQWVILPPGNLDEGAAYLRDHLREPLLSSVRFYSATDFIPEKKSDSGNGNGAELSAEQSDSGNSDEKNEDGIGGEDHGA